MKKAVVTGANGFVGSNLVEGLLQKGYIVYAVVRSSKSNISRIPINQNVHLIFCELKEISTLPGKLQHQKIDFFFHLAWEGSSGKERADYILQLNNIKCACDAVKAAAELQCEKFIFAGSIMQYEAKQYLSERNALPGRGYFYSVSKLAADYMAKIEAINNKVGYVNCLISNIYGIGEVTERFINVTIRKMLMGESLLFSKGEQDYDFIYISDAINAMILVAEKGEINSEYYIGNNQIYQLKRYIILMRDIVAPTAKLQLGAIQYNGPFLDYSAVNIDRLHRELNFKPEITFERGIKLTRDWIEKNCLPCAGNMEKELDGNNIKLNREMRGGVNPYIKTIKDTITSRRIA
jgi:nucleoside-diphosphate-sugar epimerase